MSQFDCGYFTDSTTAAGLSLGQGILASLCWILKANMSIASRMVAIGHLIGYAVGSADMISIFGTTLGDSQFKQMTVIAAVSLIFCVAVTCYAVNERVLISLRYSFW